MLHSDHVTNRRCPVTVKDLVSQVVVPKVASVVIQSQSEQFEQRPFPVDCGQQRWNLIFDFPAVRTPGGRKIKTDISEGEFL
jgi:hypothetical protein